MRLKISLKSEIGAIDKATMNSSCRSSLQDVASYQPRNTTRHVDDGGNVPSTPGLPIISVQIVYDDRG